MEDLSTVKTPTVKKLCKALEEILPHILWEFKERDKELKKKLLAELPRRTSDRIAIKAQQAEYVRRRA